MKRCIEQKKFRYRRKCRDICWAVISSAAMLGSHAAMAQATNGNIELTPLVPVVSYNPTNAATTGVSTNSAAVGTTNVANLGNVTVVGQLNQARSSILTSIGATAFTHTAENIQAQSQGENAPLTQVILRSPGVAQDSAVSGFLHVRGEHANLQYRINDIILPETLTGSFGLILDPRFVQSMQLIDGTLPAEYGFRTAGIIDIQTKTGDFQNGGLVSLYGGSYNTFNPSFEYGDTQGKWDYYVMGNYMQNSLGLENPAGTASAIHDQTYQYKAFIYASRLLSDTSRLTIMGGAAYNTFEIPNQTGLSPATAPDGTTFASSAVFPGVANTNSAELNENQKEQDYFLTTAYQKSAGNLNYQLAAYGQISGVHFIPDPNGDLVFNGVASDVNRTLYSGGLQLDSSYELGDKHTIRFGGMFMDEFLVDDNSTTVFNVDAAGTPTSLANIVQNSDANAIFAGVYLQDEWKILPHVTLNYGARFDYYHSTFDNQNQASPRVNLVYQPTDLTTLHIGYARYFTPPPLENIPAGNVTAFNGTSGASAITNSDPVKAESANYYDVGIQQKITQHFQVGVDGYYKTAKNQLDDGLFGQTLILQSFNYSKGRVGGAELTASYNQGPFSTYANFAWSVAQGQNWSSAQFLFDPTELGYVQNHWIYLDHDQELSGSFGTSYTLRESQNNSTLFYLDAIYGSGLRQNGGGVISGTSTLIPNGASVGAYYNINFGVEQDFKIPHKRILQARLDIVNITDNIYQLRSGSGVGVNAPQFGMRRGFFGSLTLVF